MLKEKPKCFDWFGSKTPKIVILGTFPGKESLNTNEYYADPYNRFWKVLSDLTNEDFENLEYSKKEEKLSLYGIAINDAFSAVDRKGSGDENIKEKIIDQNVIKSLKEWRDKTTIFFNGSSKRSKSIFKIFIIELIKNNITDFDFVYSTSRRGVEYSKLLANWSKKLKGL